MLTAMPPSSLWQRMKRSPNTRVSSLMILKLNAPTYHSAVLRGSGDFRWMWLIRNGMAAPLGPGRGNHGLRAAAGGGVREGFGGAGEREARADEALHAELRHEGQRALEGGAAPEGA